MTLSEQRYAREQLRKKFDDLDLTLSTITLEEEGEMVRIIGKSTSGELREVTLSDDLWKKIVPAPDPPLDPAYLVGYVQDPGSGEWVPEGVLAGWGYNLDEI